MTTNEFNAASIKISSARPFRFARQYSRAKFIGSLATILWGFGLIDVVVSHVVSTSLIVALSVALIALTILAGVSVWYFRIGIRSWSKASACTVAAQSGGCSQPDCDVANGGCLAKLDKEVARQISEMEKAKLAQLLRHRFGLELLFPAFWLAVGLKISVGSPIGLALGGIALAAGSLGLGTARLYLGQIVFS